jgi:CHAT domain-containing protein/tetratricopeptide (TPR) repeat protein
MKIAHLGYLLKKLVTKKFWQRIALSSLVALLTLLLGNNTFPLWTQQSKAAAITPKAPEKSLPNIPPDLQQLVQTGKQHYRDGQFAQAIEIWQQALQQFKQRGDSLNQAAVLSNLTLAYQQLSKYSEASTSISQSLNLLNQFNSPQSQNLKAQALNIQGGLLLSQGKAEQALKSWQDATETYKKIGDNAGITRTLLNQTQALRTLGLYPRAKVTLEQVLQSLQNQPDSAIKAASLVNLGDTLRMMGKLEQSQEVLQQSLAIAQKLNSPSDISLALLSLGNTAYSQKETEQAINYYQQSINESISATKLQAQLNLLRLLIEINNTSETEKLISQIQPQLDNLSPSRASVYAQVNFVKTVSKAKNKQQEIGGEINNKILAEILGKAAQQAEIIEDNRAESYALGYLGELYEKNQQWKEAQTLTEKALVLAQTSNSSDIAYRWQWQLGRIFKANDNLEAASSAYTEAVKTLSYIRNDLVASSIDVQFSFRESVEPVYREFVGLLLQAKGKQTSQSNLIKARKVIESLQIAELDNYFREACLSASPQPIDKIDPHAAVIYPIILEDRLEIVLSLPNQPISHYAKNIEQTELEKTFEQMRRSLRRTSLEKERLLAAKKVYDLLVQPVEKELISHKIKTIAFVLDGGMKNLPMAALYDGQQYLIEKYNVAITPGLELLAPQPLANKQLKILVGGLSESRQGFSALPGVESEVQQIKLEIPGQLLLNQGFTSKAIQKQISNSPFPIVHLATHGQFSSNADDTFVLTWDSRLDVKDLGELLQNREQDTPKPIELLVLSACQTAEGDKRAALGLAGVAVRSGARSTIATLWSVEDKSTSKFMAEFYEQLAKPGVTKAQALRLAQQTLMQQNEFKHPFYWAPFVLVGNWL